LVNKFVSQTLKGQTLNGKVFAETEIDKNKIAADILESIDDYVSAYDRNWNFIYLNKKTAKDFGRKTEELLGKNFWKTFPRFIGTELEKNYVEAMNKREVRRFEWETIYAKTGFREFTVFPSAEGVTVYGVDISARKKAEAALHQSEELFSKAFHGNPAPLIITRVADNHFVDVNEAFLKLWGFKRKEVVNHTSKELNIFYDYLEREKYVNLLNKTGSVRNVELRMRNKQGKQLDVIASFESVIIHGEKHFIFTLIDVTEQNRLQKNLENYTKNLEMLVEERTRQLKDKERLAAIGQTAGMVGHDIRNPLQSVVSSIYLIETDLDTFVESKEKKEVLDEINSVHEQISYMNKIVADLQDYGGPLKPELTESNVKELVLSALSKFEIPENVVAKAYFDANLPKIKTDPLMLKRILVNLATNATQAMPNGGKLTIRAHQKGDTTIITVDDTGIGISKNAQAKLFTPLFTTKSKGQGFGLAVVKRLIETLGGRISFESQENVGTKFTIELPNKPANA
jgi:PAS domain S-box-containing protein